MFRRTFKWPEKLLPLWVALICGALIVSPASAMPVRQLLSSEDFDPVEEDELPNEDPLEATSLPELMRSREELRVLLDADAADLWLVNASACRGPRSMTLAESACELLGKNGCGAILRC